MIPLWDVDLDRICIGYIRLSELDQILTEKSLYLTFYIFHVPGQ